MPTADRDFGKLAEFALPFAQAIAKLKKAMDAGQGVTLTAGEVKATVEAFRLLRSGAKEKP